MVRRKWSFCCLLFFCFTVFTLPPPLPRNYKKYLLVETKQWLMHLVWLFIIIIIETFSPTPSPFKGSRLKTFNSFLPSRFDFRLKIQKFREKFLLLWLITTRNKPSWADTISRNHYVEFCSESPNCFPTFIFEKSKYFRVDLRRSFWAFVRRL